MSFSEPVGTRGKAIASALAVLLALTASALTFFHSSAHAANNPRITISNLSLVISSGTGEDDPNDHSSRVDDIMRLSFDWDASNANASAGDSFRIGLPELFHNREQLTQDLKVSHGGGEVTIGECVLGQQDIVCTFNGQLDTLKGQGFNNPKGSGSALLKAVKATDEANASIDANGTITAVPIPGGSIADNTGFPYIPETLRKWGAGVERDSTSINWELSLGFPGLNNALQGKGKAPIAVDGQTSSTLVMTDEIGPGHTYIADKKQWILGIGTSSTRNAIYGHVTNAAGDDLNTAEGNFDLDVVIDGNRATITITGPFKQDTNYHIYYPTQPTTDNQQIQPGVVYTNKAGVQGTDIESGDRTYYVRSFDINVDLQPGFGGFKATKLLTGPGATALPEDTTFDLTVDYTLPGGATTDAYQGWDAPGTVNPDKTGGRTTLKLTAGSSATYNGTFPTGTVLTLSEDPNTASATPQGHVWGEPAFMVGDQATNTLTIQEQASTIVSVTNTVQEAPTGSFSVTKRVEGDGDFSGSTFTFSYTCDNGTRGELQVPGDGTVVTSPQIAAGAACDITEDTDAAAQPGFSLEPRLSTGSVTIKAGEVVPVTATNTYANNTGSFTVAKTVNGAAGFAADTFEIDYVCTPPAGAGSPQRATLRVTAGGPAVQGPVLPTGTTCVISESDATKAREGHSVSTTITADTTTTSTFTIVKGATAEVAVINTYTPLTGAFQVTKTVDGSAAAKAPAAFSFDYTCTKDGKETATGTLELSAGQAKAVNDVPAGSSCTVTEKEARVEGTALTTTLKVNATATEGRTATFDIETGATVNVEATNAYERTTGSFAVAKKVLDHDPVPVPVIGNVTGDAADGGAEGAADKADGQDAAASGEAGAAATAQAEEAAGEGADKALADLAAKEFTFSYTCDDPKQTKGTLKVKGDEVPVEAPEQLPVGTVCTVTEDADSAKAEGFTLTAPAPQQVTVGAGEAPATLFFINVYTPQEPAPSPSPSP
ncbi:DUF5979 domain-containing protein, partial [Actinomyces bowdenii]